MSIGIIVQPRNCPSRFYSHLEACHSNVQKNILQFSRTLAVLANNLRTIFPMFLETAPIDFVCITHVRGKATFVLEGFVPSNES